MDSHEPTTFFSLLSTRYMMSCNKSCIIGHGPSIFPIEVRKMKKKILDSLWVEESKKAQNLIIETKISAYLLYIENHMRS